MSDMIVTVPAEADNPLPHGFQSRLNGIWYQSDEKAEDTRWLRLCSPIRVIALARDGSGMGWGKLIEVTDPDCQVHRKVLPARMLAGEGTDLVSELLDIGFQLEPGRSNRNALVRLLSNWKPEARLQTTNRLGWLDDSFSSFLIGSGRAVGLKEVMPLPGVAQAAEAIRAGGALEKWREKVALPCLCNPLLIIGLAVAFSGPLLEPLGLDGGGLHLRGPSSCGKTTVQRAAVSVWGAPAFVHSWRATDNGLEGIAAACNGTVCVLDEIGEAPARTVVEAAYMLANGTGKARAGKTGNPIPQLRWRVAVLSSGEVGLADKIAEAGGRAKAGHSVRLLDIPAGSQRYGAFDNLHGVDGPAAFARQLSQAAGEAYGTAGPAFVEAVINTKDESVAKARRHMARFSAAANKKHSFLGEGQVERAVARLGLIAAAGELATSFGLTGWPEGTAEAAAMTALGLWIAARGGVQAEEKRNAIVRTRAFLSEHGSARFEDLNASGSISRIANRAGWQDEDYFYISTDAWKDIHAGSDASLAAGYLEEAGYLLAKETGRFNSRMPSVIKKRPRVYWIKQEILGDDCV